MTSPVRWLSALVDALAESRRVGEVLQELAARVSFELGATIERIVDEDFKAVGDFLGEGTLERLKSVRLVRTNEGTRFVFELEVNGRRVGAVLFTRAKALDPAELEAAALAGTLAELALARIVVESPKRPAAATPPVHDPSERTGEHWEAIGRLTATVLHELGNPVAFAVLAASQLARLAAAPSTEESAGLVRSLGDDLATSVKQMAELLAELRRVSRGPEGVAFAEPRAIVEGAVRLAHAELRGVPAISSDVGELPLVAGAAGSLGAGLALLLSSVLRGREGALSVRGAHDAARNEVVLRVSGIDLRTRPIESELRIVLRLAESAGGRAELDSEGALIVRLPVAQAASPSASPRGANRRRLLVVDDEQALARALAVALETSFVVEIAPSAKAALTRIAERSFDAVLCDVHLPGESGLWLHEQLADQKHPLANRFALASGGTHAGIESDARARGLTILAKPFDWPVLEQALARLATS